MKRGATSTSRRLQSARLMLLVILAALNMNSLSVVLAKCVCRLERGGKCLDVYRLINNSYKWIGDAGYENLSHDFDACNNPGRQTERSCRAGSGGLTHWETDQTIHNYFTCSWDQSGAFARADEHGICPQGMSQIVYNNTASRLECTAAALDLFDYRTYHLDSCNLRRSPRGCVYRDGHVCWNTNAMATSRFIPGLSEGLPLCSKFLKSNGILKLQNRYKNGFERSTSRKLLLSRRFLGCGGAHEWKRGKKKRCEQCAICFPGRYNLKTDRNCNADNHANRDCRDCPKGQYTDVYNRPVGKSMGSNDECIECPAGRYMDIRYCHYLYYRGEDHSDGYHAGYGGNWHLMRTHEHAGCDEKASCKICPAGYHMQFKGKDMCYKCSYGQYQNEEGKTYCKQCLRGGFQSEIGKTGCKPCQEGKYQDERGKPSCTSCSSGKFQSVQGQTRCQKCPPGQHQSQGGQTSCKSCGAGFHQDQDGQSGCKSCDVGKYQNQVKQPRCKDCAPGQYEDEVEQSICKGCSPGRYQDSESQTSCKVCSAGRYQDLYGQPTCPVCSGYKKYQAEEEKTQCQECAIGQVAKICIAEEPCGNTECIPQCEQGSYTHAVAANGERSCNFCPDGRYMDEIGECEKEDFSTTTEYLTETGCIEREKLPVDGNFKPCKICPRGWYSYDDNFQSCKSCDAGSYNDEEGIKDKNECKGCPEGRYSIAISLEYADQCTECPKGTYLDSGPEEPTDHDELSDCKICSKGKYSDAKGRTKTNQCKECPAGRYNKKNGNTATDHDGISDCKLCDAGHYTTETGAFSVNQHNKTCYPCPEGRFLNETARDITFAEDERGPDRLSDCLFCPDGKYLEQKGQTGILFCKNCPRGMYLDADAPRKKALDCKSCGVGTYMIEDGMDRETDCLLCPLGYHNDHESSWQGGHYKEKHHNCKICAKGKFTYGFATVNCTDCRKGTYLDEEGGENQGHCKPCPEGRWGETKGAIRIGNCERCRKGLFGNETGMVFMEQACHRCGTGEEAAKVDPSNGQLIKNKAPGSTGCSPCEVGYFMSKRMRMQEQGTMHCRKCDAANVTGLDFCPGCAGGRYGYENDETRPCKNCPMGWWADAGNKAFCSICPEGWYGLGDNFSDYYLRDGCRLCPAGKYAIEGEVGLPSFVSACRECNPGKYVNKFPPLNVDEPQGRNVCSNCKAGSWHDGSEPPTSFAACKDCEPGFFGAEAGRPVPCQECPKGYYQKTQAGTGCDQCPLGYVQTQVHMDSCKSCSPGQYSNGDPFLECKKCQPGRFQDLIGRDACKECEAGKYQKKSSTSACLPCVSGMYQTEKGRPQCIECEIGRSKSIGGSNTSCGDCPKGRFQDDVGTVACKMCPLGYYGPNNGKSFCKECDQDTKQSKTGQPHCDVCPHGQNAPRRATQCQECPPGKYGKRKTPKNSTVEITMYVCSLCPKGAYRSKGLTGGKMCELCKAGMYSTKDGSHLCLPCPSGTFQSMSGAMECIDCAINWFGDRDRQGLVVCDSCPSGYHTSGRKKSTECSICPEGRVGKRVSDSDHGEGGCVACQPGLFRGKLDNPKTDHVDKALKLMLEKATQNFTRCLECPAGWSTAGIIDKLPPDSQFGSPFCLQCAPGRYADGVKNFECKLCSFGKYQNIKSKTSCKTCQGGEVPGANRASCIVPGWTIPANCKDGQFIDDAQRYLEGDEAECEQPGVIFERVEVQNNEKVLVPSFTKFTNEECSNSDGFSILRVVKSYQANDPPGTYFLDDVWSQIDYNRDGELDWNEFVGFHRIIAGDNSSTQNQVANRTNQSARELWVDLVRSSTVEFVGLETADDVSVSAQLVKSWVRESRYELVDVFDDLDVLNLRSKKIYDLNSTSTGILCIKHPSRVPDDCNPKEYKQKYDWKCKECPLGGKCSGDVIPYKSMMRHEAGYWDVPWAVEESGIVIPRSRFDPLFVECPFPSSCLENGCKETTGGALCAVCVEGTFREFPNDAICKICREDTTSGRFTVALSIIFSGLAVLIALRRPILRFQRKYSHTYKNFLRMLAINLTYIQISTSIPSMIRVPWPTIYIEFLNLFEFVNLDLIGMLGMKCLGGGFWDFRAKIVALSLIPTVFSLFSISRFWFAKMRLHHLDRKSKTWKQVQTLAGAHLFDVVDLDQSGAVEQTEFATILRYLNYKKSLEEAGVDKLMRDIGGKMFTCVDEHGHSYSVLRVSKEHFIEACAPSGILDQLNPSWAYNGEVNRIWSRTMSNMLLILFLMHAPISKKLFAYFACHDIGGRFYLRSDYEMECMQGKHASFSPFVFVFLSGFSFAFPLVILGILIKHRKELYMPAFQRRLGFLYAPFKYGAEYWELHEVFRKMILTGMLIFIDNMKIRAATASIVSILSVGTLNYFKPHRNFAVFCLAQSGFICSALKYLCVILVNPSIAGRLDDSLGSVLMCIDILFMSSSFFFMGMSVRLLQKAIVATNKKLAKEEMDRRLKLIDEEETSILGKAWLRYAVRPGIKEPSLSQYAKEFKEQSVTVDSLLGDESKVFSTLTDLSVKKSSHQKRIFKAARISGDKLKNRKLLQAESKNAGGAAGGGGPRKTSAPIRLNRKLVRQGSVRIKVDNIKGNAAEHKEKFILRQISEKKKASDRLRDRLTGRRKQMSKLSAFAQIDELRIGIRKLIGDSKSLGAIFKKIDKDASGCMSEKEFHKLCKSALKKIVRKERFDADIIKKSWNRVIGGSGENKKTTLKLECLKEWLYGKES